MHDVNQLDSQLQINLWYNNIECQQRQQHFVLQVLTLIQGFQSLIRGGHRCFLYGFWAWANCTKFDKTGGVFASKSSVLAENWLNDKKASFLLTLTKSVEPIFQSAGSILWHQPLRENCMVGTMIYPFQIWDAVSLAHKEKH